MRNLFGRLWGKKSKPEPEVEPDLELTLAEVGFKENVDDEINYKVITEKTETEIKPEIIMEDEPEEEIVTPLTALLNRYRNAAVSEREKGTYFEALIKDFLMHDKRYKPQFDQIWTYAEWARLKGKKATDTGIDLVASQPGQKGFCAIQCKFYASGYTIQKKDIDSFFAESGKSDFTRRLFVDSTRGDWSKPAEDTLNGQTTSVQRIGLNDLEDSLIDWTQYGHNKIVFAPKNEARPHQLNAISNVLAGFQEHDRGKMIMACGTGKTFTSLKITEDFGIGSFILYLVPSLSLMSQTITEWSNQCSLPLRLYAVCSDSQVGKRKGDDTDISAHDLSYPATTNADKLAAKVTVNSNELTVIFCTYQSIGVIDEAQEIALPKFDLIICDEAHRTTGATLDGNSESNFVKVHDNDLIVGSKRLYMTATPRVYGENAKDRAKDEGIMLASMDDIELYGPTFHSLSFSKAIELSLLTDYKVIVLAVDEALVSASIQSVLVNDDSELQLTDTTKMIGIYRALAKLDLVSEDSSPMKRAVAFCKDIKSSKAWALEFPKLLARYFELSPDSQVIQCEVEHVDGNFGATKRTETLNWLKEETSNTCRILSNCRCLSEGVDVPTLDAVMFMHPRKSVVDITQAVGRVMRLAPGKTIGYIILPIGIPAGIEPEIALNGNETFKVVWQILNALRSHDDRFNAMINTMEYGVAANQIEVIHVKDVLPQNRDPSNIGTKEFCEDKQMPRSKVEPEKIQLDDFQKAVYAKVVEKCGDREYIKKWSADIAIIAKRHITQIEAAIKIDPETFNKFLAALKVVLNDDADQVEAIEMLASHIITKPVFDALFGDYDFAAHNPMSVAIQSVLDKLAVNQQVDELEPFYESVKLRVSRIEDPNARQHIITELYDDFFRTAFPRMTSKLGIVYTPNEIVDFIVHSVSHILDTEFGLSFGSDDVNIMDPFTGTGTFITRLLQSGLIPKENLKDVYKHTYAKEILLLAYYIATINIESTYYQLTTEHQPFKGICLTDTFNILPKGFENTPTLKEAFGDENERIRRKQNKLPLTVIIGNPPYSVGQKSENDDNKNTKYTELDRRIKETYTKQSSATSTRNLMDSYVRAIRWASDKIDSDGGVIGFVTNGSFIDAISMDGLRKCLAQEFSDLYVINLKGNIRKGDKREGGSVFGIMTGIAILILVKNVDQSDHTIHYYDIGDSLSKDEKLTKLSDLRFENIDFKIIEPNADGDWINQRDAGYSDFIALGSKEGEPAIFENYSQGVQTARDAWAFNTHCKALASNMKRMIQVYNDCSGKTQNNDPTKISWTSGLRKSAEKGKALAFDKTCIREALYRPFTKQYLYFNRNLNDGIYKIPQIFPTHDSENLVICVTGNDSRKGISSLMVKYTPEHYTVANGQCFPLYLYAKDGTRRDAITDHALKHFQTVDKKITKTDIFYHIYGLLHCPSYKERYKDNLTKEIPRIPQTTKEDFWAFSKAGRLLARFHINYESVKPYDATLTMTKSPSYKVTEMKFNGKDKTQVLYNNTIAISDIPLRAYDYVVNGKPALQWVMERQAIRTDKASGIVNDANREDIHYCLNLFLSVINVSLKTLDIIEGLPKLKFD